MSTETLAGLDARRAVALAHGTAMRREAFGALLYRASDRRLFFVRSVEVAALLERCDGRRPLGDALAAHGVDAASPAGEALARAVGELVAHGLVRVAAGGSAPEAASAPATAPPAPPPRTPGAAAQALLRQGLTAPICLTWELTYGCNLRCAHCLSSSGEPRPDELDTAEAEALIDELASMGVFYVNVGGGEPMGRPDFTRLMDHCLARGVGVKFSTNGTLIDDAAADWIAARAGALDLQVSLDGATAEASDPLRGHGAYARARRGMARLAARAVPFKINAVATRTSVGQLDALLELAVDHGATLRVTRLRPSGRGRDVWEAMRPSAAQNRALHAWLHAHPEVLTGDSFFHLSALGKALDGLNLCGAGRIVCCIDPVGDVYACPFVLDGAFAAGNVRAPGGFRRLWAESPTFAHLRAWQVGGSCASCNAYAACQGGCLAVKHLTGRPLDGPDPDCALGHGDAPAPHARVALPIAVA